MVWRTIYTQRHRLKIVRWGQARMVENLFILQVIVALTLSVILSDVLGLTYPGWAALSSFTVMRTSVSDTMMKALQRISGTIAGGGLALLLSPFIAGNTILLPAFCGLIGSFTVWRANASSYSYAWVLGTVTAMMVMAASQQSLSGHDLQIFTLERITEVALGSILCVLVAFLFTRFGTQAAPHKMPSPDNKYLPSRLRLMLALQAGITLVIVTALLLTFQLTGFWQAMITVLALLTLPGGITEANARAQIVERIVLRFSGCLSATVLSLMLLPLLHNAPVMYMVTLIAGLSLGCYLQQNTRKISYFGRQFTVAWIIVFVQNELWLTAPALAEFRAASIMIGIAVLSCVMTIAAGFFRRKHEY
jgi:uncharacterized membrane protein YccC